MDEQKFIVNGWLGRVQVVDSPNLLLLVHGSYDGRLRWDHSQKSLYRQVAETVTGEGAASVGRFDFPSPSADGLASVLTYRGGFGSRLSHLQKVLDAIRESDVAFERLYLAGTSYGGGLVAMAVGMFAQETEGVLLACPQTDVGAWNYRRLLSMYRDFPPKGAIPSSWERYAGTKSIIHGELDRLVSRQSVEALGQVEIIPGADHGFSGESRKAYVNAHLDLLTCRRS